MKNALIITAIAIIGAVLWHLNTRRIESMEKELLQLSRSSPRGPSPGVTHTSARPRPADPRRSTRSSERVSSPEGREPNAALPPLAAHLAGELAYRMNLEPDQSARLLPLIEQHVQTRRKKASAVLESGQNLLTTLADHAAFHAAVRDLNHSSPEELERSLDDEALEIFRQYEAEQRGNTTMLLADDDYIKWRSLLDFSGVEQEAYEVFHRLAEFRLDYPLPEGYTAKDLEFRQADERHFIEESMAPILSDDQASNLRAALEIIAAPAEPSRR